MNPITPKTGRKVLIIKVGYCEVLDHKIETVCSLGDVFWTTSILHLFKNDQVTWLTDPAAMPLLQGNPHIDRLLPFDLLTVLQLFAERFDVVVNLEKVPGLCALADRIDAWNRYGFRFDVTTGRAEAYEHAGNALYISNSPEDRRAATRSAMEIFFEMLGHTWSGESYVLGYKPKSPVRFDIGFNTQVGRKWPNKAWPDRHWTTLETLIGNRYSIDRQRGLENLNEYMEWINSCRLLVTNDSLGLHLALALGKSVVALFGPMPSAFIAEHPGRLLKLVPDHRRFPCLPCLTSPCANPEFCMEHILPEHVMSSINALLNPAGD